jgi:hypothetical protein
MQIVIVLLLLVIIVLLAPWTLGLIAAGAVIYALLAVQSQVCS